MSNEKQINYVNNLQNRTQNLYYIDDASELNNIDLKENDKIYAINDNKLFQMEVADQEQELNGEVINFKGRNNTKIAALTVNIEPIQDLHGYDNPWSAGGSYNLLPQANTGDETINGIRFQSDGNGTIHISGTASANAAKAFDVTEATMPSADIYVHLMNNVANSNVSFFFWRNGQNVGGVTLGAVNRIYKLSALTGATFNQVTIIVVSGQTVDITFSPMLCLDGTAKSFLPYSNICPISGWNAISIWNKPTHDTSTDPTVAIPLGDTVYSGTFDVTIGVLTVDRAMVDLGTLTWRYQSSDPYPCFITTSLANTIKAANNSYKINALCSMYEIKPANDAYLGRVSNCVVANSSKQVRVYDTAYSDVTTFTAAMSGVQFVYELATPTVYNLTPIEIKTLLGTNNIWADTGAINAKITEKGITAFELMPHI